MRDILFRGKRVDNGETVEGFYIFDGFNHYIVKFYTDENAEGTLYPVQEAFEVIPETVGQYTGLIDCNGKKIFEGDIIHHKDAYDNVSTGCIKYGKVVWAGTANACFYVAWFGSKETRHRPDAYYWIGHVSSPAVKIGNIHDNPEMLEATQNGT